MVSFVTLHYSFVSDREAGYAPRYSSGHDDGSSFQGSVAGGSGLGPNPNSVFDDSGSMGQGAGFPVQQQQPQQIATYQQIGQPVGHVVGAPRAIFDEDESGAREPPPLMKRTSRSALPSVDSRGWCFCLVLRFDKFPLFSPLDGNEHSRHI